MLSMAVTGPGMGKGSYKEDWVVTGIEYKGGEVTPVATAQAGNHTVSLGLTQSTAPACCTLL